MSDRPHRTSSLDPQYHTEMGRIISNWSLLESDIDNCIWRFLRLNVQLGRAVTSPIRNVRQRLQILRALSDQLLEDNALRDEFRKLLTDVENAYDDRNAIAHCKWMRSSDEDFRIQAERDRVLNPEKMDPDYWTIERLQATTKNIGATGYGLIKFTADHGFPFVES